MSLHSDASPGQEQEDRVYLQVPYRDKDKARRAGAFWDPHRRSWFLPKGTDPSAFGAWISPSPLAVLDAAPDVSGCRVYLTVPYDQRAEAKAAGASWDNHVKRWYVRAKTDVRPFLRWLPRKEDGRPDPSAVTPQQAFAEVLRAAGCVVADGHPFMDGGTHRIRTEGDKDGARSGFYTAYVDGRPAGYVKNNRTGTEIRWKSAMSGGSGLHGTPFPPARQAAERVDRSSDRRRLDALTALRVQAQAATLRPLREPTPYLRAKGVGAHPGALTDANGKTLYLPAFGADGALRTMQYIREDGAKRFAKDGRKEGRFHPVGGMAALDRAPVLVIAEGYATAASLAEALGFATVAAFDAGNLSSVALALRERYPSRPLLIAGDDDRQTEATHGVNPGRSKAEEAALAAGGAAFFPSFPAEATACTDFNDLARVCGKESVRLQATKAVERAQKRDAKPPEV